MYKIYGKENCPNCLAAKQILTSKDIDFLYLSVPEDIGREDFMSIMHQTFKISPRSFPQIVEIKDDTQEVLVGGLQELVNSLLKETR